jgi:hypothetical protein
MNHRRWQRSNDYLKALILPLILFMGFLCFLLVGLNNAKAAASAEGLHFLESSVMKATIQCYAIEGMYPPDVRYLEDNYGVVIDRQKYIVHYDVFAGNILPVIFVMEKGGAGGIANDEIS